MLPALAVDTAPALYLGRPCYFDTDVSPCTPATWTLDRYSQDTVTSLLAAVHQVIPTQDHVILIGHSGGGTLAMALAARLPQTCAVITLAGNLAVKRWVEANHFTPLPASLDPLQQPPLNPSIAQWHFAGHDDHTVLPQWIHDVSNKQSGAHYVELPDTDHLSPWQRYLVESLKALQNQASSGQTVHQAPLLPALDNSQSVCGKVTG